MNIKNFILTLDYFFLTLFAFLIVFGSMGIFKNWPIPISITACLIFIGLKLIQGNLIKLPVGYKPYILFLVTILIHTLLFKGGIIYFWLFLSGGFYWLATYNNSQFTQRRLINFIYILGLVMLALNLIFRQQGIFYLSPDNLLLPLSPTILHNHLGDLWTLILLIELYKINQKLSIKRIPLMLTGLTILIFSFSRSSIFALISGLVFLTVKIKKNNTLMNFSYVAITICIAIFVYFSLFKSAIFSRPYYLEALRSIIENPFGFGMGNFDNISKQTNVVHNLVLEVVGGLGLFSIPFIWWLWNIFSKIYTDKQTIVISTAIFFAIFVNFLFDSTYVIPGFLWLWFINLGLIKNES